MTALYTPILEHSVGFDTPTGAIGIIAVAFTLSAVGAIASSVLQSHVGRKRTSLVGLTASTVLMGVFTALTARYHAEGETMGVKYAAIATLILWNLSYTVWTSGLLYLCAWGPHVQEPGLTSQIFRRSFRINFGLQEWASTSS